MPKSWFTVLIAFGLLRLIFWFITFPNPDEAYYWLWGQHPDWSYYDHPPFNAWIQGGFTALLGRSHITLRLPNLFSNALFFYTYYCILRYLYREHIQRYFWFVVLLILASPLYFMFLALAWHDHWMITFSLLGAYQGIRFLDSYLADGSGQSWRLYTAAVALALAGLCKYNAVFLPLGMLVAVILEPRLHPLWRDRRLYLAVAIAACTLIPILLWNLGNDWQSWQYYVDRSVNPVNPGLKWNAFFTFLITSFLLVSPVVWIGGWQVWRNPSKPWTDRASMYGSIAFWVLAVSSVLLTFISLLSAALYYWNITAYLLLFPLLPRVFLCHASRLHQARLFWGGQAWGLLFAILLVIHYGIFPVSALISSEGDPDSRMLYGWQAVATVVQAQKAALGADAFVVTTDYRSASALAYQLNDRSILALSDRLDQFDFWQPSDRELAGRNAVILADDWHPATPAWLRQFERVSPPIIVPVMRFGVRIKTYYVWRGDRFRQRLH